jgi:hypothetical protein
MYNQDGSLIEQTEAALGVVEPMADSDLEALVGMELTDATSFIDAELSPVRARAIQYYRGEPFGNEEEGRSQVVSTDVRDTIAGIMPSLMRYFLAQRKSLTLRRVIQRTSRYPSRRPITSTTSSRMTTTDFWSVIRCSKMLCAAH